MEECLLHTVLFKNIKKIISVIGIFRLLGLVEIVQAKLGNDAGITGAAGLIKTYVLDKEGVK